MADYFENAEIIYANDTTLVLSNMSKYERSPITLSYIDPHELVPTGNMAIIRTLDGDANIEIKNNTILILDSNGSVKVITAEKFNSSFKKTRKEFKFNSDYMPSIKNADTGKSFSLLPLAKSCESTGDIKIYAKKLTKTTKLFSFWDSEKYMIGQKGDYLAVSQDDIHDIFIVEKNIFKKTYKSV